MSTHVRPQLTFPLGLVFVALLALLLREWFVLATHVESPIRGDIVQYMAYAWNIVEHQTFSMTHAAQGAPVPDSFRGPGYPLFLAIPLAIAGGDGPWYPMALQLQVVLSTLTCVLTVLCARYAMPAGWALASGVLMAAWPHHIAATGVLLSEIVFGFSLMLALWLNLRALRKPRALSMAACGVVYAYAYLVNPLALPLGILSAGISAFYRRDPKFVLVAVLPIVALIGWQARNMSSVDPEQTPPNRALINLVEGSWPLYHAAYNSRHAHEEAAAIMRAISAEEQLIVKDLAAGLGAMASRMSEAPLDYALWYVIDKPWLLWDWDIRIGAGDIYFHQASMSPLEAQPLLRAWKAVAKAINPALFGLCLGAIIVLAWRFWRRRAPPSSAALLIAVAFVWFTAIHALLQAEPRYAIAYRPIEMMLCVLLLSWLAQLSAQLSAGSPRSIAPKD